MVTRPIPFLLLTIVFTVTIAAVFESPPALKYLKTSTHLSYMLIDCLVKNSAKYLYLGICNEADYYEWYTTQYPEECQKLFRNATSIHNLFFQIYCNPFCRAIYFDYLETCSSSGFTSTTFYTSLCHENEQGIPCYNFITPTEKYHNPKPEVEEHCDLTNDTCSTDCFHALNTMSLELGCCINTLYNQSLPDLFTDYRLWRQCDLSTPGYCSNDGMMMMSGCLDLASGLNLLSVALMILLTPILNNLQD